jgi:hypothetical protein
MNADKNAALISVSFALRALLYLNMVFSCVHFNATEFF